MADRQRDVEKQPPKKRLLALSLPKSVYLHHNYLILGVEQLKHLFEQFPEEVFEDVAQVHVASVEKGLQILEEVLKDDGVLLVEGAVGPQEHLVQVTLTVLQQPVEEFVELLRLRGKKTPQLRRRLPQRRFKVDAALGGQLVLHAAGAATAAPALAVVRPAKLQVLADDRRGGNVVPGNTQRRRRQFYVLTS